MKSIVFITGNKGKLREVRELLPDVQGVDLDLTEIQEVDAKRIIAAKLAEAQKSHTGRFLRASDGSRRLSNADQR